MRVARAAGFLCATVAAIFACTRPVVRRPPPVAACPPRTFPIQGVCLDADEASDYCGKGAAREGGGCTRLVCPPGEAIDLSTGDCLPALAVRRLAVAHRVELHDETMLGCSNPENTFTVDGSSVACVARSVACGRGAQWADGGCHPDPTCPPGSVLDTAMVRPDGGAKLPTTCVSVVHKEGADSVLDVGTWVRLVVGPDGGEGTPAVCGPLTLRPTAIGLVPHGKVTLDLQVRLVFPDNDVATVDPHVSVYRRGEEGPSAEVPGSTGDALLPLWKTLRLMGGLASAASVTVTVHCAIENGASASAIPRSGPLPDGGLDSALPDGAPDAPHDGARDTGHPQHLPTPNRRHHRPHP